MSDENASVDPRFEIRDGYGRSTFSLESTSPWPVSAEEGFRTKLLLGWRCHARDSRFGRNEQLDKFKSPEVYVFDGLRINTSIKWFPSGGSETNVVLAIWTARNDSTAYAMSSAEEGFEQVRKLVEARLFDSWSNKVQKYQEYVSIVLPRCFVPPINMEQVRYEIEILGRVTAYGRERIPTLRIDGRKLHFGPEKENSISGLTRLIHRETHEPIHAAPADPSVPMSARILPLGMAALMLLAWLLPLDWIDGAAVAFALVGLMTAALMPAREIGWKKLFRRSTTFVAIGFFGIGAFGLAYAICELIHPGSLGKDVRLLGFPFLVSTSLGIAGGVFGDAPIGSARVLAHVQLLLFLGGVAGVIAELLQIRRNTQSRE